MISVKHFWLFLKAFGKTSFQTWHYKCHNDVMVIMSWNYRENIILYFKVSLRKPLLYMLLKIDWKTFLRKKMLFSWTRSDEPSLRQNCLNFPQKHVKINCELKKVNQCFVLPEKIVLQFFFNWEDNLRFRVVRMRILLLTLMLKLMLT